MGVRGPRDLYSRLEKALGPSTTDLTHSAEFAQVVAVFGDVKNKLRRQAGRLSARAWHVVNLPAGTDVQRLRTQLGSLDRDVRMLRLELERERMEGRGRGNPEDQHG
jgi:hypothetical protein